MNLSITETYNRPFIFIPKTILWIIQQRDLEKDNDNLIGINSSLILNLTSFIESFNKELMNSWINNHLSKFEPKSELEHDEIPNWNISMRDFLLERLTDELIIEIETSEWNKQLKLFTKITNNEINHIIESETLSGMNQLFKYRNIITHGNKLSLIEWKYNDKICERLEPNKFEGIFTFLKQQKLISGKLKDVKSDIFELTFSNIVIDYFIEIINKYLDEVKKSFGMSAEINKSIFELKI